MLDGDIFLEAQKTAYEFILDRNRDNMNSVAINFYGSEITYGKLFEYVDKAAYSFQKLGVEKGDFVAVSMLATPEGIIAFYALNKIGAIPQLINLTSSEKDIKEQLLSVNPTVLVTHDMFYGKKIQRVCNECGIGHIITASLSNSLKAVFSSDRIFLDFATIIKGLSNKICSDKKCLSWKKFIANGANYKTNAKYQNFSERNEYCSVAYTSGTTGKNKGVCCTDYGFNAMPIQIAEVVKSIERSDVMFSTLPLWIYYSISNSVHVPLALGFTLALDPLFNSKKIKKRLDQYHFNHWDTIPSYLIDILANNEVSKTDLQQIKTFLLGGDAVSSEILENAKLKYAIDICPGYGFSETLGGFAFPYLPDSSLCSVGQALPGNRYKIVSLDNGSIIVDDSIGEIYVTGPTLMTGYLNDEEETSAALIKDSHGTLWFKTGDLGHTDGKSLFIDGRIRRIVVTIDKEGMPTKLIPDKIKKYLILNVLVEDCEIITVEDKVRINIPVAFVVLKDETCPIEEVERQLNEYCAYGLPEYAIPEEYIYLKCLPKNSGQKHDLIKLSEMYWESKGQENI